MSSSSSISSFEPTPEERVPRGRVPWAAIALILVIVFTERVVERHRIWFADLAAWHWETKTSLVEAGELDGNIAVVGSSVLFHGLDPTASNRALDGRGKVVNLALNGQQLQHSAQMLDRYIVQNPDLRLVVLELWNLKVEPESWLRGPYYRWWATSDEFMESRAHYWDPSLLVSFAGNRLLPSYRYREGLDNWIFSCMRTRTLDATVRDRNLEMASEMHTTLGFARSTEEHDALTPARVPAGKERPWDLDPAADLWLHRFLGTCASRRIRVVLFLPPAPPFVDRDRRASGYVSGFERYVGRLREVYPTLSLDTLAFPHYDVADFTDDHHYSASGRLRLTGDFARWIAGYRPDRRLASR